MAILRLFLALSLIFLLFLIHACTDSQSNQQDNVFKQMPEFKEIKPRKPVKIKLKRNATGSYSWELSGDDADKVIQVDKKLRDSLETKSLNPKH